MWNLSFFTWVFKIDRSRWPNEEGREEKEGRENIVREGGRKGKEKKNLDSTIKRMNEDFP